MSAEAVLALTGQFKAKNRVAGGGGEEELQTRGQSDPLGFVIEYEKEYPIDDEAVLKVLRAPPSIPSYDILLKNGSNVIKTYSSRDPFLNRQYVLPSLEIIESYRDLRIEFVSHDRTMVFQSFPVRRSFTREENKCFFQNIFNCVGKNDSERYKKNTKEKYTVKVHDKSQFHRVTEKVDLVEGEYFAKVEMFKNLGHHAIPANGKLEGAYFHTRLFGGTFPMYSPYGSKMYYPKFEDVTSNAEDNMYLCGMKCYNPKPHRITLIIAEKDSYADKICRVELKSLDKTDNPFLRWHPDDKNLGPMSCLQLDCNSNDLWVEVVVCKKKNNPVCLGMSSGSVIDKKTRNPMIQPRKNCDLCNGWKQLLLLNEKTFVLMKPESYKGGKFDMKDFPNIDGCELIDSKRLPPCEKNTLLLKKHFCEIENMEVYDEIISDMSGGNLIAMVWQGRDAVKFVKNKLCGEGGNYIKSAIPRIHASISVSSAKREIELWFENKLPDDSDVSFDDIK